MLRYDEIFFRRSALLDIGSISVSLGLSANHMSRWKKRFTVAALCISVQFFSSGSFAKVFAGAMAIPPLLKASGQAQRKSVQLCAAEKADDDCILASQNEAAKKSLGAKGSVTTPLPSGVVDRFFLETLITPKVSRHIANSVLIL